VSPTLRLAWALCVVLFAWGFPRASEAAIRRYAVIVGNDLGAPGEEPLRYATSDARKIAEVLTSLGSVPKENLVLFENASAGDVERALIAVNDRIRVEQDRGDEAVLVVYYSGHADARALHMGRTRLDLDRMRRLVRGSAATFRLLILDACRSGALTRAKGARRIPPFALGLDEQLPGEGVVFMTASAAHEEAQESDEIRGSFFTHHLVSGLRGAADADGDGVVSVSEAYDHAYAATIRATSRSQYGTQHPHFQFDFRGQGRIALTRLRIERSGALVFPRDRSYIVFRDDARGAVIGEVGAAALRRTLLVESGTYFIRGRATDHSSRARSRLHRFGSPTSRIVDSSASNTHDGSARATRSAGAPTDRRSPINCARRYGRAARGATARAWGIPSICAGSRSRRGWDGAAARSTATRSTPPRTSWTSSSSCRTCSTFPS